MLCPQINPVFKSYLMKKAMVYLQLLRIIIISVLAIADDLIREALETHEDLYLSYVTNERIADRSDQDAISHDDVWG